MFFLKMRRGLVIFMVVLAGVCLQSNNSCSEGSKGGKYISNPAIPSAPVLETAWEKEKFEYDHSLIRRAKKKSFKVRVAISTFEDALEIEKSFFNIRDEEEIDDQQLLHIEDSDVTVKLGKKERKERRLSKRDKLTGLLTNALNDAGMFEVIERKEINQLIREINFQNSNWAQNEGVNKIGNISGVQYILTADLLRNQKGDKFGKNTYTLALRMYNVNTGRVAASSVSNFSYLKDAVMEGVQDLAKSINAEPWTCRVVNVDEGIYINAGFADKLEKNDVFNVVEMGEKIVDPLTNEVLGHKKSKVSMIKVEEVLNENLSKVKSLDAAAELKVGDIIAADRVSESEPSERELYYEIFGKAGPGDGRSSVELKENRSRGTSGVDTTAEDIVNTYGKSIVLVKVGDGFGSGFVVSSDGYIITNAHVVGGQKQVTVKFIEDNKVFTSVEVVKKNSIRDLALLKVGGGDSFSPVVLGDSDGVQVGERVIVLGNPQGLENTVTDGLISSVREVNGTTMLQTSVPISPGSSGGAMFNLYGEVVGVPTSSLDEGQNLNFAVAINHVKEEMLD